MNIPLSKWNGSEATEALHDSIRQFNVEAGRQTRHMIGLTWVIAILTFVMLVGVSFQIYLVFNPPVAASSASGQ